MPEAAGARVEPALAVLASLAAGPSHGYAIGIDAARTLGRQLATATVYGTLARLADSGLIEPVLSAPGPDTRRRSYRLSPEGRRTLEREVAALAAFVALAGERLDSTPQA